MPSASNPPVEGGTFQFLLPATKDGIPWDITGGSVSVVFTRKDGTQFAVTGSVISAPAAYIALGYTTIGQYTTLVTDLNQYGTWSVAWTVVLGSITAPFGPAIFTVRRAS